MSSSQQPELTLDDEAFTLLGDGYDLVASAYGTTCAATFSSFTYSSSNNSTPTGSNTAASTSSASISDYDNTADDALLALLADSELGEFAMDWDASPLFLSHDNQQTELATPSPTVARVNKPQSKKTKSKKASGKATTTATASTELVAPVAITKRPRKHNRIEILKLKEEMEELQAQLASLQLNQKRPRHSAIVAAAGFENEIAKLETTATTTVSHFDQLLTPHSLWSKYAEEQFKALQQSQMLNRRLRSAVAQQQSVTSSLQALFQQVVSPQDLDFLQGMPAAANLRTPPHASPRDQLLAHLYGKLESLYCETDAVCERIGLLNDINSVFTVCQTKQDAECGPVFELTTNTPVASDFRVVGRLMWSRIIENKDSTVVRSLTELELAQKHFPHEVHQKHMEMSVPSNYGALQVDGDMVFGKFEEEHRIALIVSSTCSVRNTGIVMDDNAWLVMSKGKNPTAAATTVFQAFFRIRGAVKNERGLGPSLAAKDEKTRHIQEVVVQAMGDHMRVHMEEIQNSLLSEVRSLAASLMEFKCPQPGCPC